MNWNRLCFSIWEQKSKYFSNASAHWLRKLNIFTLIFDSLFVIFSHSVIDLPIFYPRPNVDRSMKWFLPCGFIDQLKEQLEDALNNPIIGDNCIQNSCIVREHWTPVQLSIVRITHSCVAYNTCILWLLNSLTQNISYASAAQSITKFQDLIELEINFCIQFVEELTNESFTENINVFKRYIIVKSK